MYIYYMIKYMYNYMSIHTFILEIILICLYEVCTLEIKQKNEKKIKK